MGLEAGTGGGDIHFGIRQSKSAADARDSVRGRVSRRRIVRRGNTCRALFFNSLDCRHPRRSILSDTTVHASLWLPRRPRCKFTDPPSEIDFRFAIPRRPRSDERFAPVKNDTVKRASVRRLSGRCLQTSLTKSPRVFCAFSPKALFGYLRLLFQICINRILDRRSKSEALSDHLAAEVRFRAKSRCKREAAAITCR